MMVKKAIYTNVFQNARSEETRLHRKYENHRMNGEFFDIMFSCVEDDFEKIAYRENVNIHRE